MIKIPKTIEICGKTYTIICKDKLDSADILTPIERVIEYRTYKSKDEKFRTLLHEIIEVIMLERNFRYNNWEEPNVSYLFVMNHDQFNIVTEDIYNVLKQLKLKPKSK